MRSKVRVSRLLDRSSESELDIRVLIASLLSSRHSSSHLLLGVVVAWLDEEICRMCAFCSTA